MSTAEPTDLELGVLEHAHELAMNGQGLVSPNPMVGAVVLKDDAIMGEGWRMGPGTDHAEVMALKNAGPDVAGATVVCTLEPCSHHGRTPPCTKALIEAGIARVVIGSLDPLERDGRPGGVAILRDAGIDVVVVGDDEQGGVPGPEPRVHHPFDHRTSARHLEDGDEPRRQGCHRDGRDPLDHRAGGAPVRPWSRAAADAVAIGIGTAIADDPMLTVRDVEMSYRPPMRIVFDRTARLPLQSRLVESAGEIPLLVIVGPDASPERCAALAAREVGIMMAESIGHALQQLGGAEIQSVYVEGGPTLARAFLADDAVDWVDWFVAPILIGGDGAPSALAGGGLGPLAEVPRLRDVGMFDLGEDTLITGRLHDLPS